MATDRATRLLRNPALPRRASYLELFFDLAFVVGLTLASQRLFKDLSWLNLAQTMVLLAAMWWVWIATAWSTDWFNPTEPFIQRLVLAVMLAGLIMAASVAQAFGDHGIFFAGAYAAIHLGRGTVLSLALRGHPLQRRTHVVGVWFLLTSIPWLVGAFLPATPRLVLWLVAITTDFTIAWFGWPTPKLGRVTNEQLSILGEHLSERYRQVVIIGIGELILISCVTLSNNGFDPPRFFAFVISFINAALLWWIYLEPAVGALGPALDRRPPRLAVSAAYCHLIMIAGIVLTAVGSEVIITRPAGEPQPWAAVILGGSALFLAGRNLLDLVILERFAWSRIGGLVATIIIVSIMYSSRPLNAAIVSDAILFAAALIQWMRNRSRRKRATA